MTEETITLFKGERAIRLGSSIVDNINELQTIIDELDGWPHDAGAWERHAVLTAKADVLRRMIVSHLLYQLRSQSNAS